jgi:hypothetical protein
MSKLECKGEYCNDKQPCGVRIIKELDDLGTQPNLSRYPDFNKNCSTIEKLIIWYNTYLSTFTFVKTYIKFSNGKDIKDIKTGEELKDHVLSLENYTALENFRKNNVSPLLEKIKDYKGLYPRRYVSLEQIIKILRIDNFLINLLKKSEQENRNEQNQLEETEGGKRKSKKSKRGGKSKKYGKSKKSRRTQRKRK